MEVGSVEDDSILGELTVVGDGSDEVSSGERNVSQWKLVL